MRLKDISSLLRTNQYFASLVRPTLLRAAARSKIRNVRSAFHWACAYGESQLVCDLLENDALGQINHQEPLGTSALHSAVIAQKASTVRVLLSHGANPNITDKFGWKPLHAASLMGNCDIVRLLLEAGADANAAVEFRELTPLHLAIASGNHRIVELLVQLGFADVEKTDSCKITPVQIAKSVKEEVILGMLVEKLGAKDTKDTIPLYCSPWPKEGKTVALQHLEWIVERE